MKKTFIASHLKDMNRKTVYHLLSSTGEISRAEIGRQTGISAPTVLKIIDYFLEKGLVTEMGEGDTPLGRKPQLLRFNPEAAFAVGVELEGNYLKTGVVDLRGNMKYYKQLSVHPDFDMVIRSLKDMVEETIVETGIGKSKILGMGFGVPGTVDREHLEIDFAPLVGITQKKDYREEVWTLSREMELPVLLENNVNAAAIGEFVTRKLTVVDDLLYISLGAGLGAGIILEGKLRRGRRNSAGEIGYMTFIQDDPASKSRAGWLEGKIIHDPLYREVVLSGANGERKGTKAQMDIETKKHLVESIAAQLALVISNITMTLDTELVVLGGTGIDWLGVDLLGAVRNYLNQICPLEIDCQLKMCPQPGLTGAATIVTETRLDDWLNQ